MSTRKLIRGDRYRAGLWKLEEHCYEAHVRMPNAKFMIKTYRCGEAEAIEKFDSWVEAEGLDPEAASENDAALQSQDMGKEETEMQKVSKVNGQKTAPAETKAPETEPAKCYTLMCTGDLGTAPVMVFRNEGDANDMMLALEQVAKVTSPDTVYDVMEAPFKEAI